MNLTCTCTVQMTGFWFIDEEIFKPFKCQDAFYEYISYDYQFFEKND